MRLVIILNAAKTCKKKSDETQADLNLMPQSTQFSHFTVIVTAVKDLV